MVVEVLKKENGKDRAVGRKILIWGKEVRLQFTMPVWLEMEEKICSLDDIYTMMHDRDRLSESKIPTLASLMTGGELTAREIATGCDPATMYALMGEMERVISRAITMKEKKYDDDSVHDETLEEIEKKEPRAD